VRHERLVEIGEAARVVLGKIARVERGRGGAVGVDARLVPDGEERPEELDLAGRDGGYEGGSR
jgi:hypothetical protein